MNTHTQTYTQNIIKPHEQQIPLLLGFCSRCQYYILDLRLSEQSMSSTVKIFGTNVEESLTWSELEDPECRSLH